jgi:DNA-binding NarL/FixJ family response regulator
MVSVALIDDHPAVRAGVEAMLAPVPDLQLIGSAAGEPEIWSLLNHHTPTVVVLDLHHPGRDGLALCLAIKHRPDPPAVVLYSAATPSGLTAAAAVAGTDAIVGKADPAAALINAIRTAALPHPTGLLLSAGLLAAAAAVLDPADHAILAMRLAGNRAEEIADTLRAPLPVIETRIQTIVNELMGRPATTHQRVLPVRGPLATT